MDEVRPLRVVRPPFRRGGALRLAFSVVAAVRAAAGVPRGAYCGAQSPGAVSLRVAADAGVGGDSVPGRPSGRRETGTVGEIILR